MAEEEKKKEWPKLDPEFKAKWVAALRSGDYQQGRGTLCQHGLEGNLYCRLGVAGDVVGIPCSLLEKYLMVTSTMVDASAFANGDAFSKYPKQLIKSGPNQLPSELAMMNDGIGQEVHNFLQIADWIEENL